MISGDPTMRPVKSVLWLVAALAWSGLAQAQTEFNLESLFALMSGQTRVATTFTEKKFIKGLDAPIESSGELGFEAPSRMVKRTLLPKPETLTLDERMVTVERGRQMRTLSLDDYPELAVHIEGIRACLAGDRAALDRVYHIELSGNPAQWKMKLVPRNEKAAAQVKAIHLGGEQADIRTVQVLLTDGDSSIMHIALPHSH
jgi:hypothetical protein